MESDPAVPNRYSHCLPFLVEDNAEFGLLLAGAFQKAGVLKGRIRLAVDGEKAIERLRGLSPDALTTDGLLPSLIVLDLNLPTKSGLEVLAWVREFPALAEVPVFILSASEDPSQIGRAYELRTDSYFVKPAGFAELLIVVEGMLGFWHTRTHRRLPRAAASSKR